MVGCASFIVRILRRFGSTDLGRINKKSAPHLSGALLCRAKNALINYNKVRVARADHALRVCKPVHVNRDPAAVQEDEVGIADQPEMVRPVSLDEELFRMPPKTEHFAMTRSELFLVYRRRLIRVHVRLAGQFERAPGFSPVYMSVTFNICLSRTFVPVSGFACGCSAPERDASSSLSPAQ